MKLVDKNDPILYTVIPEFAGDVATLRPIAAEMLNVMVEPRNGLRGIGLAAPQVGLPIRMFVMLNGNKGFKNSLVCINPVILERAGGFCSFTESCLSYPGARVRKSRANRIKVQFRDLKDSLVEIHLEGLQSICFQHELDHLNGVTIVEHKMPTVIDEVGTITPQQMKAVKPGASKTIVLAAILAATLPNLE